MSGRFYVSTWWLISSASAPSRKDVGILVKALHQVNEIFWINCHTSLRPWHDRHDRTFRNKRRVLCRFLCEALCSEEKIWILKRISNSKQILELICIGSSKKPISNGPLFFLLLSCFDARVSAGFTDADCRQGKSLAPFQTSTGSRGRALRLRLLRRKQRPCGRGWWPGGCLRSSVSSYTKARALAQCFSLVCTVVCTRGIIFIETLRTMIC